MTISETTIVISAPTPEPETSEPVVQTVTHVVVGAAVQLFAVTRWTVGRTGALLTDLAEKGAAEQQRARRRLAAAGDDLAQTIATNTLMNRVVDAQLARSVRPLVTIVLDDVLKLLDDEPERIRSLIRSQRETITDDVIGRVRAGAVAGDATVDRMTSRLLRRNAQPQPTPP